MLPVRSCSNVSVRVPVHVPVRSCSNVSVRVPVHVPVRTSLEPETQPVAQPPLEARTSTRSRAAPSRLTYDRLGG